MEHFRRFGTVFVKEDRETGKVVQKPCMLRDKVVAACNATVAASATPSRERVANSCDKIARDRIAGVTSVLGSGFRVIGFLFTAGVITGPVFVNGKCTQFDDSAYQ